MVKKGDTLIEVLLAVGIFSMIAISVVAVMSGGTSSAQTALETTLAREEIDVQAEALRYIHDSYINDKNSENTSLPTVSLWRRITNQDNVYMPSGNTRDEAILQYAPEACPTNASELPDGAFILDPRDLNTSNAAAYKSLKGSNSVFAPATTFPRLVFGAGNDNSLAENSATSANTLSRAEGIYVIAVADYDTTTVLDVNGQPVTASKQGPAFYDFYIRTCWYGTDADTPSTISTVIRLHNPDVKTDYAHFNYKINDISSDTTNYLVFKEKDKQYLYEPASVEKFWPWKHTKGWSFDGWCLAENVVVADDGSMSCRGGAYQVGDAFSTSEGGDYDFVPVFSHIKYTIEFNTNGGSWQGHNGEPRVCYEDENDAKCAVQYGDYNKCVANKNKNNDCDITRSGYAFKGWCTGSVSDDVCNSNIYQSTNMLNIPSDFPSNRLVRLTAIWGEQNEKITIKLTWNTAVDYDSYIYGTKDNGESFTAYYSDKKPTETVSGVTRILAELDHDCTSWQADYCKPSWNETFTVNTLGGKNYYYSVRNFSNDSAVTGATVTVSGDGWSRTFNSNNATGSGRVWNVFAYKNGQIITPGANGGTTRSGTAVINY